MRWHEIFILMLLYLSEITMLYLIINNLSGHKIKESFENFILNKQRVLWENVGTLLLYLGFLFFILLTQGSGIAHAWAHVATPIIVVFLMKQPTVSKVSFGLLCHIVVSTVVYTISFPFAILHNLYFVLIAFTLIAAVVLFFNIPRKLFEFIESEGVMITLVSIVTAVLFVVPFFDNEHGYPIEVAMFLPMVFVVFMVYLYVMNRESMTKHTRMLAKTTTEVEVIDQLKTIAITYEESEILLTFTLKNVQTGGKFARLLEKKLDGFGRMSEIKQEGSFTTVRILNSCS